MHTFWGRTDDALSLLLRTCCINYVLQSLVCSNWLAYLRQDYLTMYSPHVHPHLPILCTRRRCTMLSMFTCSKRGFRRQAQLLRGLLLFLCIGWALLLATPLEVPSNVIVACGVTSPRLLCCFIACARYRSQMDGSLTAVAALCKGLAWRVWFCVSDIIVTRALEASTACRVSKAF